MAKDPKKPFTATDRTAQALRQVNSAYDELRRLTATDRISEAVRQATPTSFQDELRRFTASDRISEAARQVTTAASTYDLARSIATPSFPVTISAPPPAPPRPSAPRASTSVSTPADLGRMVRQAREAMSLTQAEFADMAGVGRRFVSELENGKATLELGKVMAACAAAGLGLLAGPR